jgi:group I intron endonuclease
MAISKAILKHGSDNFEIKILSTCSSLEEMNHREQYYIRLFNTLSPLGYNVKSGGHNSRMSEETKKKISNSLKGKPGHSVSQNTFSVNI